MMKQDGGRDLRLNRALLHRRRRSKLDPMTVASHPSMLVLKRMRRRLPLLRPPEHWWGTEYGCERQAAILMSPKPGEGGRNQDSTRNHNKFRKIGGQRRARGDEPDDIEPPTQRHRQVSAIDDSPSIQPNWLINAPRPGEAFTVQSAPTGKDMPPLQSPSVHVMELFSVPRVCELAGEMGLRGQFD